MTAERVVRRYPAVLSVVAGFVVLALAYVAIIGWSHRARANWMVPAAATFGAAMVAVLLDARGLKRSSHQATTRPIARPTDMDGESLRSPRAAVPGLSFDVFFRAKSTSTEDEWEDAWAADLAAGRFAVADGASSAFLAQDWARALVEAFVEEPAAAQSAEGFSRWLRAVRPNAPDAAAKPREDEPARPWWEHEARLRGSYATLIGLVVSAVGEDGLREWSALSVGDTCLVHLRPTSAGLRVITSFPIDTDAGFGTSPDLLGSRAGGRGDLPPIRSAVGTCEQGDLMVLMTDAVAQFSLAANASPERAWDGLLDPDPDINMRMLEAARAAGAIVDDDVTILRVRVG
jgi:hypothetical protein